MCQTKRRHWGLCRCLSHDKSAKHFPHRQEQGFIRCVPRYYIIVCFGTQTMQLWCGMRVLKIKPAIPVSSNCPYQPSIATPRPGSAFVIRISTADEVINFTISRCIRYTLGDENRGRVSEKAHDSTSCCTNVSMCIPSFLQLYSGLLLCYDRYLNGQNIWVRTHGEGCAAAERRWKTILKWFQPLFSGVWSNGLNAQRRVYHSLPTGFCYRFQRVMWWRHRNFCNLWILVLTAKKDGI